MKKLKYLMLLSIVLFVASCEEKDEEVTPPAVSKMPAKEMRAVWMATAWGIDWPKSTDKVTQQKQYTDYLDKFLEYNINTVFVQVRGMGDAYYDSTFEPWSKELTGTQGGNPNYDVLKFMIDEAHARGLEFHAWMNPYRINSKRRKDAYPPLDSRIKPEWTVNYHDSIRVYNPALPEVQDRLVDIVKDLVAKYEVDGLHFDDYFYPYFAGVPYIDTMEYRKYGKEFNTVGDFRRSNVNKVVERVSNEVRNAKKGIVFSISPASDQTANYNNLNADVVHWNQKGWLDMVVPQVYQTGDLFRERVHWWPQFSYKSVPMIGYWPDKITVDQLKFNLGRQTFEPKVKGTVLFSASIFNNGADMVAAPKLALLKETFKDPAVMPFIGEKIAPAPTVASNVAITGATLNWNAANDLRSVVYRMDGAKARVVAITKAKTLALTEKGDYFITTINKDNVESAESTKVTYK